nr:FecR family protein [Flavisolibacter sp.]
IVTYLFIQKPENELSSWNEKYNNTDRNIIFSLNDSTVVTLAPNSTLRYPIVFDKINRQVYLSGEAEFNVKKNDQNFFKVYSKKVITTVLGTIFTIKEMADSAIVIDLREGKLKVEIEDSTKSAFDSMLLYPNEKAMYVFHTKHLYKKYTAAEIIDQTMERISFRQSSFEEIANHLKKVFGKTLINQSDKKNWRFTGEFNNASVEEIIENICFVKNLSSKIEGDTIFIINKKHTKK